MGRKLEQLARGIERFEANGVTSDEAEEFAKAKQSLATMRARQASLAEQQELGREIGRQKGYKVN